MTERNLKFRLKGIQNGISSGWAAAAAFFLDFWRLSQLSEDWSGSAETLRAYWRVYGGHRALLRSPAFLFSIGASVLCFPLWTLNNSASYVLSIVPNLLGFTIGAMAVVLAFPTTTVFEVIAEDGRDDSYYLELVAKFIHFAFVQVTALVSALVTVAFPFFALSFLTLLLLFYAITTGAMTVLALFEVAIFYNKSQSPDGE